MRGETVETEGRAARRRSRYRILLGLVPLALLFAAVAPSPAAAQNDCDGTLQRESSNQAALEFSCNFAIPTPSSNIEIRANKDTSFFPISGSFTGGTALVLCQPAQGPASGEGEPNNFGGAASCAVTSVPPGNIPANTELSGEVGADTVCDPLELRIKATGSPATVTDTFDLNVTGCPSGGGGDGDGDGGGGGGGADGGPTPQGGVQSGAGGSAGDSMGDALLPVGLGLILAGTLGVGALALARRRA
jgi:hypothetical protein